MKKLIFAFAITGMFALAVFAQTPTPPAKNTPAQPAASGASAAAPTGGTGAEGKLAYINSGRFTSDISELKVKIEALNAEFEPKKKEVQAEEEALNNLKNKINTQGSTVSAQVRAQWAEEAQDKEKSLTRKREDYQQIGQKRLTEITAPSYEKIGRFLETYCQQRGIVLLLEGGAAQQAGILIFAAQATDVTDDFIKEYNKANPAAGGAAPQAAKKP
ncbi:MAG TPA: OmpH family outer membrane protein [Blastocatellia bacterium]|jgi:outer membrane protein|nr:OmpH family outer membrane protein [Blastocatellia bacterium]